MKTKALSLWQPWASLIAVGAKTYETRSWATSYRGPLLICAAKRIFNLCDFSSQFRNILFELLPSNTMAVLTIPFGQAIAVVELTGTWMTGAIDQYISDQERLFGDFSSGRYAWKLENVRAIEPFPVKGRQGLFEVEIPEGLI